MTVTPSDRKAHWERVYEARSPHEVTWHQNTPDSSLQLIDHAGIGTEGAVIDVGGGASLLVDHLLDSGLKDVTVADISEVALDHARERLGERAQDVRWICGDVTQVDLQGPYDLWHDRAVFHFLTDAEGREAYTAQLKKNLRHHGQVVIATFALDGPDKCSGLPVVRYSPDTLADELGETYELVETWDEDHQTPKDNIQRFVFCRFKHYAE